MEMADSSDLLAREIPDAHPGPDMLAERHDMMQRINQIIMEELTDKQRQALMAVAMQNMPLEEAAQRMGMSRNTLYKLMHDARLRLKHRLQAVGLTPQQVLAAFEQAEG
jgi:RNA polymerase sigma-70 factor (ECF subfamily)